MGGGLEGHLASPSLCDRPWRGECRSTEHRCVLIPSTRRRGRLRLRRLERSGISPSFQGVFLLSQSSVTSLQQEGRRGLCRGLGTGFQEIVSKSSAPSKQRGW